MDDEKTIQHEAEIGHSGSMRLLHLGRAGLALAILALVASFGTDVPICPPDQQSCGSTPLWEGLLVINGVLLVGFALFSALYALSLNRRWEGVAHNFGSWVTPALLVGAFALALLVATADFR